MTRAISAAFGVFLILLLSAPPGARAGAAGDLLFAEGSLSRLEPGTRLIYRHSREADAAPDVLPSFEQGEIRVTLRTGADGMQEALVAMAADDRVRELNPFPASSGNPVLLTFLESSLRAMASMTGGSPFYIRNRMKEALRNGGEIAPSTAEFADATIEARVVTFRPFANDKNRDRMGAFADLRLRFVLSEQAPGGFVSFIATTPEQANGDVAFRERIVLRSLEQDG